MKMTFSTVFLGNIAVGQLANELSLMQAVTFQRVHNGLTLEPNLSHIIIFYTLSSDIFKVHINFLKPSGNFTYRPV
jgi:hypothetical protein